MTTTKTPNYTDDQIVELRNTYPESPTAETVEALASKMGKTTKSIVAKLVQLGIYCKPEAKKTSKAAMGKADMAAAIAKRANLSHEEAKDLTKLGKQTLVNLLAAVEKIPA